MDNITNMGKVSTGIMGPFQDILGYVLLLVALGIIVGLAVLGTSVSTQLESGIVILAAFLIIIMLFGAVAFIAKTASKS